MIQINASKRLAVMAAPHPWAKEMLDVVKKSAKRADYNEIAGDMGEGAVILRSDAAKILKAFKEEGFETSAKGKVKIVKAKGAKGCGLSFDYSDDNDDIDVNECVVLFFSN